MMGDDDVLMADRDESGANDAAAAPIVTGGLFKKKKKTAAATTTATTTTTVSSTATSVASTVKNNAPRTLSVSRLSFDLVDDLVEESATEAKIESLLQARRDRNRTRKKSKLERTTTTDGDRHQDTPIITQEESTNRYTPEALAALRRNARPFSTAVLQQNEADRASSKRGVDVDDLEPEVNLAALPSASVSSVSPFHSMDLAMAPSNFRSSSRNKQLALQEADDIRAATTRTASGRTKSSAIVVTEDDDASVEVARRNAELDRLAEERLIRHAKLQRQRLRQQGVGQDADLQFAPTGMESDHKSMILRDNDGRLATSSVEFDRSYAMAIIDEDDPHAESALLRDDPDDAMLNEYDDEMDGREQGQVTGDRIRFGDPVMKMRSKKRLPVGALLTQDQQIANRKESIRKALQHTVDDLDEFDDFEGGAERVDDETLAWEEELMRKGGARPDVAHDAASRKKTRSSSDLATAPTASLSLSQQIESSIAAASAHSGKTLGSIDPIDVLLHGLNSQLQTMKVAHQKSNDRYRKIENALIEETATLHKLRDRLITTTETSSWYQDLAHKLITLLDCLSEKARDVDAAWAELGTMRRTRQTEIHDRINLHVMDLYRESFNLPDHESNGNQPPRVDEFGRTVGFVHGEEKMRRRALRQQWMEQQMDPIIKEQNKKSTNMPIQIQLAASTQSNPPPLGWVSFRSLVEMPSELGSTRYTESVDSLVTDTYAIFSDVREEFQTLDCVVEWMEDWKRRDRDAYESAFIPESMPIILATYVKLELIQRWNLVQHPHFSEPTPTSPPSTNNRTTPVPPQPSKSWYDKLFNYGMDCGPPRVIDGVTQEDADSHLLPSLVDQVLLPIVSQFVQLQFDPYDDQHIRSLRSVIDDIEAHLIKPGASVNLKGLKAALFTRFRTEVHQHQQQCANVPSISPTDAPSIMQHNQAAFALFRFHSALHLFASLVTFEATLNPTETKALASQHLVQSLLPFLAWKCAQVDHIEERPSATVSANAQPTELLLVRRQLGYSDLEELQLAATKFVQVFPTEWITSQSSASSSVTQLYHLLTQLRQSREKCDLAQARSTVKQLRVLLKK